MSKFFTVTVKPTITASKQALGAFADGDVLFDWTAFDVPKGACKLINTAMFSRGADGVINSHAVHLYFGKSTKKAAPNTIGTIHATASGTTYYNSLLGATMLEENDQLPGLDFVQTGLAHFNRQGLGTQILQGEPESGTNVGYDKLYVAGLSIDGTPSFASTIQCDGIQATTQNVLTVKTTSCRNVFDVGDVIHDEDDRLMGTIASVDSATQMTMEDNLSNATVNNKDLYVISPITLQLMFEK